MTPILNNAVMWWSGRTQREQRLLIVMALLLAATLISFGIVRPVLSWRAAAADRAEAAAADLVDVRAAVVSLAPTRPGARPAAGEIEPLIRRTAEAAGLEVVTLMSPSGQLGFQLSRVGSGQLFGWLAVLETDHGLAICSLGVTENTDTTLNVEGAVSAGTCAA